jgi:hypothetical protein
MSLVVRMNRCSRLCFAVSSRPNSRLVVHVGNPSPKQLLCCVRYRFRRQVRTRCAAVASDVLHRHGQDLIWEYCIGAATYEANVAESW